MRGYFADIVLQILGDAAFNDYLDDIEYDPDFVAGIIGCDPLWVSAAVASMALFVNDPEPDETSGPFFRRCEQCGQVMSDSGRSPTGDGDHLVVFCHWAAMSAMIRAQVGCTCQCTEDKPRACDCICHRTDAGRGIYCKHTLTVRLSDLLRHPEQDSLGTLEGERDSEGGLVGLMPDDEKQEVSRVDAAADDKTPESRKMDAAADDADSDEELDQFPWRSDEEISEAYNEFRDKVWWNRHQDWAYEIRSGKKVLTAGEKGIWETAERAASRIERKYGRKNLGWNDVDWGILQGRMSALAWVMGMDWDVSMDT